MDQNEPKPTVLEHQMEIRVRYHETDGQGRVHHAQYINYFERGRVELLRAMGKSYREIEEGGLFLVVSKMEVEYLNAAEFDDLLKLTTRVAKVGGVRIQHEYMITKSTPMNDEGQNLEDPSGNTLETEVVRGMSVVACVDRRGKVRKLPEHLRAKKR